MPIKKLASILFIIAFIFIASWFYKAYKTVPDIPAYENTFMNEKGETVNISDFKGRYLLVSYFQTWCGDCIQELPSIDALQTRIGKDQLKVLMVSDEGIEKINHFKEKYCNTLEYFQSKKSLNELKIRVFPTTYLIDKNGVVIISKLEGFDWNSDEIIKLFK